MKERKTFKDVVQIASCIVICIVLYIAIWHFLKPVNDNELDRYEQIARNIYSQGIRDGLPKDFKNLTITIDSKTIYIHHNWHSGRIVAEMHDGKIIIIQRTKETIYTATFSWLVALLFSLLIVLIVSLIYNRINNTKNS